MKSSRVAAITTLLFLGIGGSAAVGTPPTSTPRTCAAGTAAVPCASPSSRSGDSDAAERRRKQAAAKRRKAQADRRLRRDIKASSVRIADVIDADTLIVKTSGATGKTFTVQVLGINPPQTSEDGAPQDECGSQAARALVLGLGFPKATDSVPVRLSVDPRQRVYQRGSGNLLAYVDVAAGARGPGSAAYDIGETVIASGYSRASTARYDRARSYLAAEKTAKQAGKSVWTQCAGNFHATPAP